MLYIIALILCLVIYRLVTGKISKNISRLVNFLFLVICLVMVLRYGFGVIIIFGALIFVLLSILSRSVDINQCFKSFGGVDFGGGENPYKSKYYKEDKPEVDEAYKILGLNHGASTEEINKAYKNMMSKFHPDKAGGSEYFAQKINQARDILLKKSSR